MKRDTPFMFLYFLLLIVALVLTTAHQAREDEATTTPTPWLPPRLTPDREGPTRAPGWWNELPTAIPFPSPTKGNEMSPFPLPILDPFPEAHPSAPEHQPCMMIILVICPEQDLPLFHPLEKTIKATPIARCENSTLKLTINLTDQTQS